MRIGFDAHILAPEHHKYHPEIAAYTRELLRRLVALAPEQTFVVFLDERTPPQEVEEFTGKPGIEIRHFPFTQYRAYLPFFYSHLLVSAFLTKAKLDLFHSPEGLIPYLYPGPVVATFHWVPLGEREANVFSQTWMFGARLGFAALVRKAERVLLRREGDKKLLCDVHGFPEKRAVVAHCEDLENMDWDTHARQILGVYKDVKEHPTPGLLARIPKPKLPRPRLPRLPRLRRKKSR